MMIYTNDYRISMTLLGQAKVKKIQVESTCLVHMLQRNSAKPVS